MKYSIIGTAGLLLFAASQLPAALPAPWQHQDIGGVNLAGDASYSGSISTVTSQVANLQVEPLPYGEIVYDNTTTSLDQGFVFSTNEFGDEILLAGTPRECLVLRFTFKYLLSPSASGLTAWLRFYDNTGPTGAPNNLLYSSGPIGISQGFNDFIAYPTVEVPSDFTWTVQFNATSGNPQALLLMFNPPTVGSSPDTFWRKSNGTWSAAQFNGLPANFGAQVLAARIVSAGESCMVQEGTAAYFSIQVAGEPPLSLQWFLNGQPIADATNSVYLIPSASPGDAGTYTVIASNAVGSVTNEPATLGVNNVVSSNFVGLVLTAPKDTSLQLQSAPSIKGQWSALAELTPSSSPYAYIDFTATNAKQRFYRSLALSRLDPEHPRGQPASDRVCEYAGGLYQLAIPDQLDAAQQSLFVHRHHCDQSMAEVFPDHGIALTLIP
jgi:hypothetical protein